MAGFLAERCESDGYACHQATKLRDEIAKVRVVLANTEQRTPETIKQATSEMQKASLKLFEMAYRKVSWFLL